MNNYSIWLDNIEYQPNKPLNKDIEADILIIGGGITGISLAYFLKNSNLKIALVEKNIIGHGITARTTGKLTYLQENIYSSLSNIYNLDIAKMYLSSQVKAIELVKNIVKCEKINCDFKENSSFLFTDDEKDINKIIKEKECLEKLGIEIKESNFLPDKRMVKKAIYVNNTAVFHPLKYIMDLKKKINKNIDIYENTIVTNITDENDYYICQANNFKIKAKKIALAMHYPYFLFPYLFPLKTHLEKSYIAACPVGTDKLFNAITIAKPTLSLRYAQNDNKIYKLTLAKSHNIAFQNDDANNFEQVIKLCEKKPKYIWSNKDIITSDKLPLIGKIKDNLYLATGYNTWGMTNGTIAGFILSDLLQGKHNEYEFLFNPLRGISKNTIISLPINLVSTAKSFIGSKVNKNKSWYNEKIRFEMRNGKSIAIYTDNKNKEHIVYNICPHLKCSLIFNEIEKTWDCPCHGSRFDIDGHSIEGPSNFDITYKG